MVEAPVTVRGNRSAGGVGVGVWLNVPFCSQITAI